MIISFLNQKGGVGKTTLATSLADALARRKMRVLLVDADPQGSALDWSAAREGTPRFPVVGLPKKTIHTELPAIAEGYAAVVIDGPPRVYDLSRSCIMASDLVLIPVQPLPYDVWAANEIIDLITVWMAAPASPRFTLRRSGARSPASMDVPCYRSTHTTGWG
jgi:chromosome partitioning protein